MYIIRVCVCVEINIYHINKKKLEIFICFDSRYKLDFFFFLNEQFALHNNETKQEKAQRTAHRTLLLVFIHNHNQHNHHHQLQIYNTTTRRN